MTDTAPSCSPTKLIQFRQEIEQGVYDNSSPRLVARALHQATRPELDAVLKEKKSKVRTDDSLKVVHYTSLASVIAMLNPDLGNKRYLRMYNAIGFNDPGEGRFFMDLAKEHSSTLEALLPEGDVDVDLAYIASFIRVDPSDSESPHDMAPADHLMFWLAYGREGAGCSLTLFFDAKEDEIHNVVYGERNTIENIKAIAEGLQPLVDVANAEFDAAVSRRAFRTDELSDDMRRAMPSEFLKSQIHIRLKMLRYLYKSDPFQYENECRCIVTPDTVNERGMATRFDYSGSPGQEVVKKYIEHPSLAGC